MASDVNSVIVQSGVNTFSVELVQGQSLVQDNLHKENKREDKKQKEKDEANPDSYIVHKHPVKL